MIKVSFYSIILYLISIIVFVYIEIILFSQIDKYIYFGKEERIQNETISEKNKK